MRLDKFLRETFPEFSRHWMQKLIKESSVLVNGASSEPSYVLRLNDVVRIALRSPDRPSIEPDAKIRFEVVYEDNDIVVINKPSGLVTHPSDTTKNKTLVNGLLARWPEIDGAGEDPMRPGIVHRLDKDTSGLLVVAKHIRAFEYLKRQFQERKIIKRYIALVEGVVKQDDGVVDAPIMRDPRHAVKQSIGGEKNAITFYKVKKRFKKFTLLIVQPKTGRRHQIRVHCSFIGHPVAGDTKYGAYPLPEVVHTNLLRYFLHAYYLELDIPNGQHKIFEIPLSDSLENILKKIK